MSKLRNIETVDEFNDIATEILENFALDLIQEGESYYLTQEEKESLSINEDDVFVYTKRADNLLKRMEKRLGKVGNYYFPNPLDEVRIETDYFREIQ